MTFLTDFADGAVLLPIAFIVAIVLASGGWRRGALAWIAAAFAAFAAIVGLKLLFFTCGPTAALAFGVRSPSGHTAAAAVIYGGLAVLLGLPVGFVLTLSVAAAILVGASRLALGVHTLLEVAIGAGVGCVGAALMVGLAGPRPPGTRTVPVLGAALLVVLVLFHGLHLRAEPLIQDVACRHHPRSAARTP